MKPKYLILIQREEGTRIPFEAFPFYDAFEFNAAKSDLDSMEGNKYHFSDINEEQRKAYSEFSRQADPGKEEIENLVRKLTELGGKSVKC